MAVAIIRLLRLQHIVGIIIVEVIIDHINQNQHIHIDQVEILTNPIQKEDIEAVTMVAVEMDEADSKVDMDISDKK
jgi:hypothetical protein